MAASTTTGYDETKMWIVLSKAENRIWIDWIMMKLKMTTQFSDSDLRILKDEIAKHRLGFVHMLTQDATLRLRSHAISEDPDLKCYIVRAPLALQRTTASNIRAALDSSAGKLSVSNLMTTWAPVLAFSWAIFIIDRASGNSRYQDEIIQETKDQGNMFVLFVVCFAHGAGHSSECLMDFIGMLGHLVAWSKLCKQMNTVQTWMVHLGNVLEARVHFHAAGNLPADAQAWVQSSAFLNRIARFTIMRSLTGHSTTAPIIKHQG